MVPFRKLILAIVSACVSSIVCVENNVPVYIWNIDSDAVVNPLHSLSSDELVAKVSLSLDRKLIALFVQDELSVEDFKSEDLASLKSLAEADNDGTFYAPSVAETGKLSEILQAAGFKKIHVKSHKDLPSSPVTEKTLLVVDLPATQLGDSRSENLQLNGNAISEVYEVLKSQHSDVIGIFTGKKNSKLQMDESRRRITRNAPTATRANGDFNHLVNVTTGTATMLLYLEKFPVLKIKDDTPSATDPKNPWANFTLSEIPDSSASQVNETDLTALLSLTYVNIATNSTPDSALKSATIRMHFTTKRGYWKIKESFIDYDVTINGKNFKETNLKVVPMDIETSLGFSYHCSPTTRLATYGFTYNGTNIDYKNRLVFEMHGFQLQPFRVKKDRFGDWNDCQGFFTEGIWAAIILGLIIAMMLAWAVSMLADVKSPDRFDDPKGKTITVTATD